MCSCVCGHALQNIGMGSLRCVHVSVIMSYRILVCGVQDVFMCLWSCLIEYWYEESRMCSCICGHALQNIGMGSLRCVHVSVVMSYRILVWGVQDVFMCLWSCLIEYWYGESRMCSCVCGHALQNIGMGSLRCVGVYVFMQSIGI